MCALPGASPSIISNEEAVTNSPQCPQFLVSAVNPSELRGATSKDVQLKPVSSKSSAGEVPLEVINPWITEPVTLSHIGHAADCFSLAFDLSDQSHNINNFGIYFQMLSWIFESVHCACLGHLLAAAAAEERLDLLADQHGIQILFHLEQS